MFDYSSMAKFPLRLLRPTKPDASVGEIVEAYLSTLKPKSQINYRKSWRIFSEYVAGKGDEVLKVTHLGAQLYIKHFSNRKGVGVRLGKEVTVSKSTLKKESAVLKRLYDVVFQEKRITRANPFEPLYKEYANVQVKQRRPTELIPFEDVNKLLNRPDRTKKRGVRDRAILALLLGGALRRSEASNLNISSVKKDVYGNYSLSLAETKNGDDAEQPLADFVKEPMDELLAQRLQEGATPEDPLFVDYRGEYGTAVNRRLGDAAIYFRVKLFCRLCGLSRHISPHSARATSITKLLEDGMSHREVKEFSRHAAIESIESYDKKRTEAGVRAAKKLSF